GSRMDLENLRRSTSALFSCIEQFRVQRFRNSPLAKTGRLHGQEKLVLLGCGELPLEVGASTALLRNVAVLDLRNLAGAPADYWTAVATGEADRRERYADTEGREFRDLFERQVLVHCGGICSARRTPGCSSAQHGQAGRNGLFPYF